ncbi:hypothetical protein H1Q63_36740 [Desmonostoc muscorum CCALA 125]|nr:hypothetical protein [Desmonostoc muscorum CCALA 125]
MTYSDSLRPWAIYQYLPDSQENKCVTRFRNRFEADCYVTVLRQGGGVFEVVYDHFQPQPVIQG